MLATFAETGGPINRFGRIARTLARWHARRLTLAANRNAIIARGRRGVLVGFLSSAAWTATVGLLMGSVAAWATGEIDWFSTTLATASIVGGVAAVAGILGGWWLGRAAGKRAAIKRVEGRWGWVIFRVSATLLVLAWLTLGGMAMLGGGLDALMLVLLPTAAAACIVLPAYTALLRAVIWPPHTTRLRWPGLLGLSSSDCRLPFQSRSPHCCSRTRRGCSG